MTYNEVSDNREKYIELLLVADPDRTAVEKYLHTGTLLSVQIDGQSVGILHYTKKENAIEINNIGVLRSHLRKGIGSEILKYLVKKAKDMDIRSICLGTGNFSIDNFVFYQKNGFEMDEIWKDYFVDRYVDDIFENGIRCKHMVRFKLEI